MIDISKCANESCPLKLKCYRYFCPAGSYQDYSDFKWEKMFDDKDDSGVRCDGYWKKKMPEAISFANEFNMVTPWDLDLILESLEDSGYLSKEGEGFRHKFWEMFIKKGG